MGFGYYTHSITLISMNFCWIGFVQQKRKKKKYKRFSLMSFVTNFFFFLFGTTNFSPLFLPIWLKERVTTKQHKDAVRSHQHRAHPVIEPNKSCIGRDECNRNRRNVYKNRKECRVNFFYDIAYSAFGIVWLIPYSNISHHVICSITPSK